MLTFLLIQAASSQTSQILGFLPMVLMFAIIYFVLILPMQRQRKQHQEMLGALKNGDTVTTSGGIVGTVVSLDTDAVVLRVKPDNVKLQVKRSAVSGIDTNETK